MDLAPFLVARGRWGNRMGDGQLYDSVLRDGLNDAFSDAASSWHTEDLVKTYQRSQGDLPRSQCHSRAQRPPRSGRGGRPMQRRR